MECQSKEMMDTTQLEEEALGAATQAVGEYIESIGKADAFAGFDPVEFNSIIDCAVFTFTNTLATLHGSDPQPRAVTDDEREIAERASRDMAVMDLSAAITKLLAADIAGQGLNGGPHREHIQPPLDQLRLLWKRLTSPGGYFSDVSAVAQAREEKRAAPGTLDGQPLPPPLRVPPLPSYAHGIEDDDIPF